MNRTDLYNLLHKQQNGCCAICEKHSSFFKKKLCLDHNHASGEYRGLLCSYCNRYLVGRFKDPELVRKIADYLEHGHTGVFMPKRKKRRKKSKKLALTHSTRAKKSNKPKLPHRKRIRIRVSKPIRKRVRIRI